MVNGAGHSHLSVYVVLSKCKKLFSKKKKKKHAKGLDMRRVDASPAPVGPVRLPLLPPQSSLLVGVSEYSVE